MLKRYIPGQGTINIGVQDKVAISVGATGPRGPQGPPGPATTIGATGVEGPRGYTGLRGEKGDRGIQGDIGPSGPMGLTGPSGPTGPEGSMGPTGETGPRGIMGLRGELGPSGPKGDMGDSGPMGPSGPQGPPGPATTIGATGAQGPITPAGVYFCDNNTRLLRNTITTEMKRTGQAAFVVPQSWGETTNAYLQASMSIKLPSIYSTVTFKFLYSVGNYTFTDLRTIYTCGSDQLIITGMLPNVSVGDHFYIVFNTQIDDGRCEILDITPISGAIYHVS